VSLLQYGHNITVLSAFGCKEVGCYTYLALLGLFAVVNIVTSARVYCKK